MKHQSNIGQQRLSACKKLELNNFYHLVITETLRRLTVSKSFNGDKLTELDKLVFSSFFPYSFYVGEHGSKEYGCKPGFVCKTNSTRVAWFCEIEQKIARQEIKRLAKMGLIEIVRGSGGSFNSKLHTPLIRMKTAYPVSEGEQKYIDELQVEFPENYKKDEEE